MKDRDLQRGNTRSKTTMMENRTLILLGLLVAFCCAVAGIPGGFETVDVNREDVVKAANEAARSLSKTLSSKYHHRLHKIKDAKSQVVAGTNYKMTLIVGMTTCEKKQQSFDDAQNCDFQDNISTYKKCIVLVNRSLKDQHKLVTSGCILASRDEI